MQDTHFSTKQKRNQTNNHVSIHLNHVSNPAYHHPTYSSNQTNYSKLSLRSTQISSNSAKFWKCKGRWMSA